MTMTIGTKITARVTVRSIYRYTDYSFNFYGTTKAIYTFVDNAGNVYVWNTTSFLGVDGYAVEKGDVVTISGAVKGTKEYKGEEETVLTRVKLNELHTMTLSGEYIEGMKAKIEERKKAEQMASIQEGDMVYEMPYKQYKEHYGDCETVIGSYIGREYGGVPMISVIVRKGRLVNSGVRFEHFNGYEIHFMLDGREAYTTYRAVNEENAMKRAKKEYPNATAFICEKVFNYR